jgi:hypothetical protein
LAVGAPTPALLKTRLTLPWSRTTRRRGTTEWVGDVALDADHRPAPWAGVFDCTVERAVLDIGDDHRHHAPGAFAPTLDHTSMRHR